MSAKAAVVGVGRMGRRHLQALQTLDVSVVAIADLDDASLAQGALLTPDARPYRTWEQLLHQERVDLLCVATTSPSHEAIVCAAAAAGVRRVLCEKPLATSLRAGKKMNAACRAAGVRLVVNHSRRLFEPYRHVHAAIERGIFGDVRFMRVTCGGSGLANIGTHAFDLMRWFCGSAIAVTGYVDPVTGVNPRGPQFHDPGGHGLVILQDGRRATFDFSSDFAGGFIVELGCSRGRIVLSEQNQEIDAVADGKQVPMDFGPPLDLVAMTAAMLRNGLADDAPACAGEDALAVLEIAAAVHVSDSEGHRSVLLPLSDDQGVLERIA